MLFVCLFVSVSRMSKSKVHQLPTSLLLNALPVILARHQSKASDASAFLITFPLSTFFHFFSHQVIKANDDLTPEHHQFFLYQMLRGLKYIHSGGCWIIRTLSPTTHAHTHMHVHVHGAST